MNHDDELERELRLLADAAAPGRLSRDEIMSRIAQTRIRARRGARAEVGWLLRSRIFRLVVPLAAAAAVLAFIGWWPVRGRPSAGIAWADVLDHMNCATTAICRTRHGTVYMKDPGLSRLESGIDVTSRPADSPERIEIWPDRRLPWSQVTWLPASKQVYRNVRSENCPEWPKEQEAGRMLAALREVSSTSARRVGEAQVAEMPTIVFVAPATAYFKAYTQNGGQLPELPAQLLGASLRVYVSKQASLPVKVEVWTASGELTEDMELQWNVPLADELFQPPAFDAGWTISDTRFFCFAHTGLKPGNTLRIGPTDGAPIVTELDLQAVRYGDETVTSGPAVSGVARTVWLQFTPVAYQSLRDYANTHIGEKLTVSFNGVVTQEETLRGPMMKIDALGITFEQFEQQYLSQVSPLPAEKQ